MGTVKIMLDRFPQGLRKALVFSFDDGREHDRKLVSLMNKHGLRGTFHLNSGMLGQPGFIEGTEVSELFRGHEISAHTVTHPFLHDSPIEQIAEEILSDRQALERLAGYPVRGMSYPFGTYNERVLATLPSLGIEYSRTVESHGRFTLPEQLLRWHPTCHHKDMLSHAERFLASQPRFGGMELLFVWGHSFEFHDDNNWELMEQAGAMLGGNPVVWYATMSEVALYRQALDRLRFSVDRRIVHNPSALDVWFSANGEEAHVAAGATVAL